MIQATTATPDAAADMRIDPQIRSFLAKINKDSSPFWETAVAAKNTAGDSYRIADTGRHVRGDHRAERPSLRDWDAM